MANKNADHDDKMDEFRRALTSQGLKEGHTQTAKAPQESTLDRFKAALGDVAERSTEWVSSQVHQGLQGFVNHALLGGSSSPELTDKREEHEPDKEMDR
jgi:hypothetical protein